MFDGTCTTDGRKTVRIDFDQIELTAGNSVDLIALWLSGAPVSVGIPIGPKVVQVEGTINGVQLTSDVGRGVSNGKYNFVGGAPDIS